MKRRKEIEGITPYVAGQFKKGAIKMASNENPLGSSPKAVAAVRKALDKLYLYPDCACTALKEKIAVRFGLSPENVVTGNGSDEILLFIAGAYMESGGNAVTSASTFSEYTFSTRLFGGSLRYAPLAKGKYQLAEIKNRIDAKTRAVFLANPNNPTGTYFTEKEFLGFMDGISPDVLVVLDEAYSEYVQAKDFPRSLTLLPKFKNIIILRTFSKIYGLAGLRIGYGLAAAEIIRDLNCTREPFNVNVPAQQAAIAALDDSAFVRKSIAVNEAGKKYLYRELEKLGLPYLETQANFIYFDVGRECMPVFETMKEKGVIVRPLKSFGLNTAIRVTVGTRAQNEQFIKLLRETIK